MLPNCGWQRIHCCTCQVREWKRKCNHKRGAPKTAISLWNVKFLKIRPVIHWLSASAWETRPDCCSVLSACMLLESWRGQAGQPHNHICSPAHHCPTLMWPDGCKRQVTGRKEARGGRSVMHREPWYQKESKHLEHTAAVPLFNFYQCTAQAYLCRRFSRSELKKWS